MFLSFKNNRASDQNPELESTLTQFDSRTAESFFTKITQYDEIPGKHPPIRDTQSRRLDERKCVTVFFSYHCVAIARWNIRVGVLLGLMRIFWTF